MVVDFLPNDHRPSAKARCGSVACQHYRSVRSIQLNPAAGHAQRATNVEVATDTCATLHGERAGVGCGAVDPTDHKGVASSINTYAWSSCAISNNHLVAECGDHVAIIAAQDHVVAAAAYSVARERAKELVVCTADAATSHVANKGVVCAWGCIACCRSNDGAAITNAGATNSATKYCYVGA